MAFTKIVGAGIHTLSNVHTHNVNSSGIITATSFVGPFNGSDGDFSGNVTIDGNLTVNGTTTTLDTNLTEVDKLEVAANNSTVGAAITQSGTGDILNLYDGSTEVFSVADGGDATFSKKIILPDSTDTSDGRLVFGATNDMMLFHYGGANYIDITTNLNIRGSSSGNTIKIKAKQAEESIVAIPDGAVELYHDNNKKFQTQASGAKIFNTAGSGGTRLEIQGQEGNPAILQLNADDGDDNADYSRIYHGTDGAVLFENFTSGSWETNIKTIGNGAVELYHNNLKKLSTISTGIEIHANEANNANIYMTADEGDDNGDEWILQSQASTNNFNFYNNTSGSAAVKLSIKPNGDVGFTGDLLVPANITHSGDTDTKIRFPNNDAISFETAGDQRLRIYDDGYVIIGSTSRSGTVGAGGLDIQGNSTNCILEMGNPFPSFSGAVVPEFRITATNSGHTVDFESVYGGDNLLHKHLSFAGGVTSIHKGINDDEVARFTSSGTVGIGTNSPKLLLHLHQQNSNATFAHFTNTTTGVNANQGVSFGLDSDENATIYHYENKAIRFATGGTERLRIAANGAIGIAGANYGSSGQVLTSQGSGSSVTWSTVTGTTINNNADNRVITGSGTANTLEAESELTYDGTNLLLTGNSHNFNFKTTSNYSGNAIGFFDHSSSSTDGRIQYEHSTDELLFETGSDWRLRLGNDTLRPQSDNAYKLGSSSYRFANIYSNYISGIINVASTQTISEFRNQHSTYGGGVRFKSNNTYGTIEIMRYDGAYGAGFYNSTGGWHWDSNMQFHGNVLPWTNNAHDLGTSSKRWRNIYTNDLNLSNEGGANDVDGTWGNFTIQEGEDDLFLINKRSGKKYKFNLTEVS